MPLRITNLRLPVTVPETAIGPELARRLGIVHTDLARWRILRKSLDGRARHNLKFVYSVAVDVVDEPARVESLLGRDGVERYEPVEFDDPPPGDLPLDERPIVVGSGPAGLLAAYYLAVRGYRPLVVERGPAVRDRVRAIRDFDQGGPHDPENNYLFGEGGAGAFSDGKLTCRQSGPDVNWVLERFADMSRVPSVVYDQRPHLGSNRLPAVVRRFRQAIEAAGGEYRFGCRLEGLVINDGRLTGLATSSGTLPARAVVLAIGHSARDTYQMLHETGIAMEPKAFQMGLRIEQPQEQVNQQAYGRTNYLELLGAADYSLVARGNRDVFTFCMCAGGHIIPSVSEPGMFCTNGMSHSRRDTPYANSGLVVTLEPAEFGSDHPLAGIRLQQQFEAVAHRLGGGDYRTPVQRVEDFLATRVPAGDSLIETSYSRGAVGASLDMVVPVAVARAIRDSLPILDRKLHGDLLGEAVLVGPEMRGSSPVRILRDQVTGESPSCGGLYPVGEGAGFAGGIISAAVDGLRAARRIVGTHVPPGA